MHVLFLAAYYPPEKTADTHLEQDLIEGMAKRGWKVDIVCPTPTRGCSKEDIQRYKRIKKETQYDGKVIVHRFWAPQEKTKAVTRALRYLWCCIRQISIGKRINNIDAIYCNSTPPIQGLAAHAIKKKTGSAFIYSLQDLFPDSLVTAEIAKKESFPYKIGLKIERKTYNASNSIITLSESFKKIISGKGVEPKKIIHRGCVINLGAIIDHGCIIEEGCHICLGAIVKGENRIKRLTKIEAGEVIQARKWPVS